MSGVKVLIAAGIYPPAVGGPATHLAHLLPHLLARGLELRAVAFAEQDAAARDTFPTVRITGAHWTIRNARYGSAFRRHEQWADVVYATSMGLPRSRGRRPALLRIPGDLAWERAVNRGLVPMTEDIDRFQHARHGSRVALLKWLRRREARSAARIVVPSDYLKRLVVGWGIEPARIAVVHSAATYEAGTESREELRQRLGWTGPALQLVSPVRLVPWKGIDLLIDAVNAVPGVALTVLGDGPQRAALETRARRGNAAITFLGDRPADDVRACLRAADYCVVYSGYEGLSHTLLESLACGTPVIASRRGGNPEIVMHGENGLLVDHPDAQALTATLRHAAEPQVVAQLRTGASLPLHRFATASMAAGIANELERLAGSR